jgi:hypothetical protein
MSRSFPEAPSPHLEGRTLRMHKVTAYLLDAPDQLDSHGGFQQLHELASDCDYPFLTRVALGVVRKPYPFTYKHLRQLRREPDDPMKPFDLGATLAAFSYRYHRYSLGDFFQKPTDALVDNFVFDEKSYTANQEYRADIEAAAIVALASIARRLRKTPDKFGQPSFVQISYSMRDLFPTAKDDELPPEASLDAVFLRGILRRLLGVDTDEALKETITPPAKNTKDEGKGNGQMLAVRGAAAYRKYGVVVGRDRLFGIRLTREKLIETSRTLEQGSTD